MKMTTPEYVVCIRNEDYAASLERRKIYQVIPDPDENSRGMLRLVDESGEDYLFPEAMFLPISLPEEVSRALAS